MIQIEKLSNGLTLIVEEMDYVSSVAYDLMIPGGIIYDASDKLGTSLLLAELTTRGAGKYTSRALTECFDGLGIRHSEAAKLENFSYRGSMLVDKLPTALNLLADMVMRPHLPESELENVKNLYLQDLRSLDDDPASKAFIALGEKYYPNPYGRSTYGTQAGLENTTIDDIKTYWDKAFQPAGAILSIAGKVKFVEVKKHVLEAFTGWNGTGLEKPKFGEVSKGGYYHVDSDTAQLQITLAYPSAKLGDSEYYAAKVAAGILSGGMFGRLFVEVREKLGLCYSVYARHAADEDCGTFKAYAGTVPERADKTLEVMLREIRNLGQNLTTEELERAKANYLSSCVIVEESVNARVASNLSDYWLLGYIRELKQIAEEINAVTIEDIINYSNKFPLKNYTVLTLGPRKLEHMAIDL